MKLKELTDSLNESLLERFSAIATMLADSALLAVWLSLTWFCGKLLEWMPVTNTIDKTLLTIFQVIFGLSTLVPVLSYTIVDICNIIKNGVKRIK